MKNFRTGLIVSAWLLVGSAVASAAPTEAPLLLRFPTVSRTDIVFNYADSLWTVPRGGGEAHLLTAGAGVDTRPFFSPDGSLIAFDRSIDGARDVYTIAATGGEARRITFHPGDEVVRGWSADGKRVLFSSSGSSFEQAASQLYTVPPEGGFPTRLPLPRGEAAAFSPDGEHLAYVPHMQWQAAWKRYRGGQTTPLWIADLRDSSVVPVPRENSNDGSPMWIGDRVYFLSDRNGPVSLFAYDLASKKVTEVLHSDGYDFKTASAGPDAIVIEQFGAVWLFDLATQSAHKVDIHVHADPSSTRPRFVHVNPKRIQSANISPTGARAVFEAWGEIFTVPTDKGDIRNLTHSPAVADRSPAWSPDGKWIAYFSDAGGEYALQIRDQSGQGSARRIDLGGLSYYYDPVWSPDSRKIAYSDKHLGLWYVDVQSGARKRIDTDYFEGFSPATMTAAWSPDNRWIAYSRSLRSGQHAVFVYSLDQDKTYQVTDGMSDVLNPVFDRNGKYLYFTASTNVALTAQGLDMSSQEHLVTRSVYVVVLSRDDPSPLSPESDEDKGVKSAAPDKPASGLSTATKAKGADAPAPLLVKIDLDHIGQRILALPLPAENYLSLKPGKSGILFVASGPMVVSEQNGDNVAQTLQRFDLNKRRSEPFLQGVNDYWVSADGEKLLYRMGDQWLTAGTEEPPAAAGKPTPGLGPLKLDDWQVYVDPKPMWQQIYDETWRIERDYFYDPHYHGLDLDKIKRSYAAFLPGLASRDELTYLFEECLGEMTVGHMFVGGPRPEVTPVKGGLLGADYVLEGGRYRIARVYDGENWNPELQAPLTQPGVNVGVGDYVLAINSHELHASDDIQRFLEGTAGKQVVLKVAGKADGAGAREVTVVPVESEAGLRHLAWVEDNRRRVDQATGGRVAYVYVPDTHGPGYTSFNRYFFSQVGKEAVIVDERFNEGGQLADYIVNYLGRPLMSKAIGRDGHEFSSPSQAIYGPKVMIINEMSGSGGDALPWYFRKAGLGPLVGKRTWGGLVGIGGYPPLIDGGFVTAPRVAIYGLKGDWEVENHGIPPDIDVDLDPQTYRKGHDAQLEQAIAVVLQQLEEHPLPSVPRPAYPNYHVNDGLGSGLTP